MSTTSFRIGTPDDAEPIARLVAEVVSGPNPVGFESPLSAEQVRTWIDRLGSAGAIYLAQDGEHVVGFGALDFDTQAPDTATLGVWVESGRRGEGIGTALAELLLEHAREHGFKRIVGRLPENNEAALSFLSAIGGLVPIINPEMRFELPL